MSDISHIREIEEVSMNALPALRTNYYDGWVLRFANGYTRRSNSVNPLYESRIDTVEKIERCEKIYRSVGLDTVFKMTDAVSPRNLDDILIERGYKPGLSSPVSIQTCSLRAIDGSPAIVFRSDELHDSWLNDFIRLNNTDERYYAVLKSMLTAIVPKWCCFSINIDGEIVACGLAVCEAKYVGLFDIVIAPDMRRQRLGTAVTLDIMRWGKENGADTAYLQVVANNEPAVHLYENIGFEEAYKYWYRVKKLKD